MSELPSASTTTPPPAATTAIGTATPTPAGTAAALRASSSCDRGPGTAVTRRRSCGRPGPPVVARVADVRWRTCGDARSRAGAALDCPRCPSTGPGRSTRWIRCRHARDAALPARTGATSACGCSPTRTTAPPSTPRCPGCTARTCRTRRRSSPTGQATADDRHPVRRRRRGAATTSPTPTSGGSWTAASWRSASAPRSSAPAPPTPSSPPAGPGRTAAVRGAVRDLLHPVAQANAEAVARDANATRRLGPRRAARHLARRDAPGRTRRDDRRAVPAARLLGRPVRRLRAARPLPSPPTGVPAADRSCCRTEARGCCAGGQRASLPVRTATGPGSPCRRSAVGGHLSGVLAIANGGALDRAGREVVTAVIALAGLALQQNRELARARGLLRTGLLTMLSVRRTRGGRRRRRARCWGPLPAEPVRIAAVDVADHDLDDRGATCSNCGCRTVRGTSSSRSTTPCSSASSADDTGIVDATRRPLRPARRPVGRCRLRGRSDAPAPRPCRHSTARREGRPGIIEFGDLAREGVLAHLAHIDVDAGPSPARSSPRCSTTTPAGTELTRHRPHLARAGLRVRPHRPGPRHPPAHRPRPGRARRSAARP